MYEWVTPHSRDPVAPNAQTKTRAGPWQQLGELTMVKESTDALQKKWGWHVTKVTHTESKICLPHCAVSFFGKNYEKLRQRLVRARDCEPSRCAVRAAVLCAHSCISCEFQHRVARCGWVIAAFTNLFCVCARTHVHTTCALFTQRNTLDSSSLRVHSLGHTSRRTRWTARISVCWHTVHTPRLGHTLAVFLATTTLLTVSATALSFLTHKRRERSRSELADDVCVDVLVVSVLAPKSSASQDHARPHHGKPG